MDRKIYISTTGTIERVRMEVVQMVACKIEGCDRKCYGDDMCNNHTYRIYSENIRKRVSFTRLCEREGCYQKHAARGLCKKHYNQHYKQKRQKIERGSIIIIREAALEANVRGDDESLFNDAVFLKECMGLSCSLKGEEE